MYAPLSSAVAFALLFVYVELRVAPEPILAPFLLKERIPVLVGVSNFLVATCNFTVMYNFPTWFQTVLLTSASEAGACAPQSFKLLVTTEVAHVVYSKWLIDVVAFVTRRRTSHPQRDFGVVRIALRWVGPPQNKRRFLMLC